MPDIDGQLYTSFLTNNDPKALEALFNKYRDGLILFIYGFVQNIDEAEELMMDTFAVLVSGTARYKEKANASFKTWLYAIAKNTALKAARKTSREVALTDDEAAEESLEDAVISDERRRTVRRALGRVSKDYREALYLVYIEQMPNGDAAKVMKKSKRQIENLLYRAKSALRRELEKEGFTYEDL